MMEKNFLKMSPFALALAFLCFSQPAHAVTRHEPTVAVVVKDGEVTPVKPGEGHSVPPGSTVKVVTAGKFMAVVINKPPVQPTDKDRIVSPKGQVIEIVDSENVDSITEADGMVTVKYKDGLTVVMPGEYLAPGEANPTPSVEEADLSSPDSSGISPETAEDLFTGLFDRGLFDELFGVGIDLSDFDYDFGGTDLFPISNGPLTFTYADSTSETLAFIAPVPIPATFWLLGAGLVGFAGFGKRRQAA